MARHQRKYCDLVHVRRSRQAISRGWKRSQCLVDPRRQRRLIEQCGRAEIALCVLIIRAVRFASSPTRSATSVVTSVSDVPTLSMASAMSRIGAAMSLFERFCRGTWAVRNGVVGQRRILGYGG
jgi:hypothetical protein